MTQSPTQPNPMPEHKAPGVSTPSLSEAQKKAEADKMQPHANASIKS